MIRSKNLNPFQFSLKAMLLAAICCGVAVKLCVWQHGLLAKEMSIEVLVFVYAWNVAIAGLVACLIWGWVWLSGTRELAASRVAGDPDKDLLVLREQLERRRAYIGSVAWGALSLVSWIAFAITWLWAENTDDLFVALFSLALLHLLPLGLAAYVRFAFFSKWKRTRPLAVMRLAAFASLVLPTVAFTLLWLQS